MQQIWKYELTLGHPQEIEMPVGAEILTVQSQFENQACLWALVEPANYPVKREFEIFGTGVDIYENPNRKYIGTYQLRGGIFVFHVFENVHS